MEYNQINMRIRKDRLQRNFKCFKRALIFILILCLIYFVSLFLMPNVIDCAVKSGTVNGRMVSSAGSTQLLHIYFIDCKQWDY